MRSFMVSWCILELSYQYAAILQYNIVQYNSIHFLRYINILHRAIYCSVLHI